MSSSVVVPHPHSQLDPYRLPSSDILTPTHYDVALVPDLDDFTFQGHVIISVTVFRATSVIECHASDLTFPDVKNPLLYLSPVSSSSSSSSSLSSRGRVSAVSLSLDGVYERLLIKFENDIAPGDYALSIPFKGQLNDKLCGFYRSKYIDLHGVPKHLAVTQFEATDARRALPCWDEPGFKATFSVRLVIKRQFLCPQLAVLSNMPSSSVMTVSAVDVNNNNADDRGLFYPVGSRIYDFIKSPKMSSYLLAFFVGEVDTLTRFTKHGTQVNVHVPPTKAHLGTFSLDTAVKCLEYFNDYFDVPYPLPKCDLIAIPDFAAGAMENWGLITYREVLLLVDPVNSSAQVKQRCARVVAHEISHQWFGNLVTMNWWNNLWLNEGFARLMEHNAVNDAFPEWDIWTQFISDTYAVAQAADAMSSSHPIQDDDVHTVDQINEQFDSISYAKGACVIRMLNRYIGENAFRKGIQVYLRRHAYSNTIASDLWRALTDAARTVNDDKTIDVAVIMEKWITTTGYPILSVSSGCDVHNHSLSVTQSRFLSSGEEDANKKQWNVPILSRAFPLDDKPSTNFLLVKESDSFTVPTSSSSSTSSSTSSSLLSSSSSSVVKINLDQSGFYRVFYSPAMLSGLQEQIRQGHLPPIERLGVVRDIAALSAAGRLPVSTLLSLLVEYNREDNFAVLSQISSTLSSLWSTHRDNDDARVLVLLKRFIASLFRHAFTGVGLTAITSSISSVGNRHHLDALSRAVCVEMLALADDDFVIEQAKARFDAHVQAVLEVQGQGQGQGHAQDEQTEKLLSPDLRASLYNLSIRHNSSVRSSLLSLYKCTSLSEERIRLLRALSYVSPSSSVSAFSASESAASVLSFAFSGDNVRTGDLVYVFAGLTSSKFGREYAWSWAQKNMHILTERFSKGAAFMISHILTEIISGFSSNSDADIISAYFTEHPVPAADRAIKQAIETVRNKAARKEREQNDLKAWLIAHDQA